MAVTFPSPAPTSLRTAAEAPPDTAAPPAAAAAAAPGDDSEKERDYARKVAGAWLTGILVMTTLVTLITMVGGRDDIGIGGCLVVGIASGFWVAPIVGVVGIGRWASRWEH